jgi:hypothetical protein
MGTNYFCHIIPTKERKKELYNAIEANDFSLINKLHKEMYDNIYIDYNSTEIEGGVVHLGKMSAGWKFLWNPNVYIIRNGHLEDINGRRTWVEDPNTGKYVYPLTKQGLHDFIFREDVLIYDEYGELQDKEEFWKDALEWGSNREGGGWDAASYEAYEMKRDINYRLYPVTGELIDFLKSEGYKFTSWTNSDFYSDGLRFASSTEFS